ncbi:MAG: glycosyltransferase family 1 protein [Candidatus Eisenbacteria bacterium]
MSRAAANSRFVLVDASAGYVPGGGIGRYVRDLTHALRTIQGAPPARFLATRNLREIARERFRPEEVVELPVTWRQLAALLMAGTTFGIPFDAFYHRPALVHSPLGYGPTFHRARLLNHIHDLTCIEHPEWHTLRTRMLFTVAAPRAARAADMVLSHSEYVRQQVVREFGVRPDRTIVIPPPLGHGFTPLSTPDARAHVSRRFGIDGDFVLHVGTLEPRKNHVTLVAAFERLCKDGFPGPLVLVGQDGWKFGAIGERLASSPVANRIVRVRDADDHDLTALYGACTCSAFPSLAEGFGMPLLESMACGAACVISDHPVLVELGRSDCVAVPATDADAMADALRRLWREPDHRAAIAAGGPARAQEYAFPRWAGRIFTLYRELLALGERT